MSRKVFSYYGGSEFHNKMLKVFLGISLIQGAFFFAAAHALISKVESLAQNNRIPASHSFYQTLQTEETFLLLMVTVSILISTVVFVYLGLRYSHDAVGAVYRMKSDFEKMAENGNIEPLNLRRNDYFKDIEKSFNNLVEKIKK